MKLPCNTVALNPYIGLWRRDVIVIDGERDVTTRVYWLQTSSLYADIRIPMPRPAFDGITALGECDEAQRLWLAQQEGFAGCLHVDGDTCRWERFIDFQAGSPADVGRMEFNADGSLTEHGVHIHYREEWSRIDVGDAGRLALVRGGERRGIIVAVGDFFMAALERPVAMPAEAKSLIDAVEGHCASTAAPLLSCELSFGRVTGGERPWQITLSTMPFREGASLFSEIGDMDENMVRLRVGDGILSPWRIVEFTADFQWISDASSPARRYSHR